MADRTCPKCESDLRYVPSSDGKGTYVCSNDNCSYSEPE